MHTSRVVRVDVCVCDQTALRACSVENEATAANRMTKEHAAVLAHLGVKHEHLLVEDLHDLFVLASLFSVIFGPDPHTHPAQLGVRLMNATAPAWFLFARLASFTPTNQQPATRQKQTPQQQQQQP